LLLLGKEILKSCILLLAVDGVIFLSETRVPDDALERLEKLGKLRDWRDALDIDGALLFLSWLKLVFSETLRWLPGPGPLPGEDSDDNDGDDELPKKEPTEPGGIENLTSERTGIKIIPLFESATTFIKGSSEDNAEAAAAAGPARTPAPCPCPCPCPCPGLSNVRRFSGILICLIFIDGFLGFWSCFLFGSCSI
jgi:hypothetical protein